MTDEAKMKLMKSHIKTLMEKVEALQTENDELKKERGLMGPEWMRVKLPSGNEELEAEVDKLKKERGLNKRRTP